MRYFVDDLYTYDDTYDVIVAFGTYYNKASIVMGSREFVQKTRESFKEFIKVCLEKGYIKIKVISWLINGSML